MKIANGRAINKAKYADKSVKLNKAEFIVIPKATTTTKKNQSFMNNTAFIRVKSKIRIIAIAIEIIIVVIDISPRMPGSPGISSTPYGNYLYGQPLSVGQRVAMEIKEAIKLNSFVKILS